MEQSLKDLFNFMINNFQMPLLNALNELNPFSYIYVFINNLINSILNIFGKNDLQIQINNELVVQIFVTFITIWCLVFIINLFKFTILKIKDLFNNSINFNNQNYKGEWRQQWKRKKKKRN